MNRHKELIDSLAQDLQPGQPPAAAGMQAFVWWLAATVFVVMLTLLLGPLRSGALEQLLAQPRFFIETLFGLLGIGAVAMAVMASAIPGRPVRSWLYLAATALAIWFLSIAAGLVAPSLELGMLGKRPHCFLETLIYALPPMLLGIVMVRRSYPLHPVTTGMGVGLVAGLLPAWFMQMACMYETVHILTHHVVPGLLMVPVAGLMSWVLLRRPAPATR